ncbi:hybrid sensor histidine kinase/response regulator [Melittangium boletus]|uniref:histidine kinase n=1 Tax=Melittangium boletus DSM 14713 TaxID=1294270 RepID=A0A250IH33_9BACT|nr:ATP-binding protein [Melittangium boletus]ATB30467.1 two-component system sensor histidine kinase/response regulator [Melittangium boletus DSM 14713]
MSEREQRPIGGGEMGALIRAMDWSQTPLGPVEGWSAALCTSLSTVLASPTPMALYWGPHYVHLYNDAYCPLLGTKHPAAMGLLARDMLQEIRDIVEPMLETVHHSMRPYSVEDQPLLLERRGFREECFFTWSFIPTRDEHGRYAGIVAIGSETTHQVLGTRRFQVIRELSIRAARESTQEGVFRAVEQVLAESRADVPFALLYRVEGERARRVVRMGLEDSASAAPLELTLDDRAPWPLREVVGSGQELLIKPWDSRPGPSRALLLPMALDTDGIPNAVLGVGLNPRLRLDEDYRDFLRLLSRQVAADAARARASEEERRRGERLAELDRAKTAFFSNISHEFRTPLTLMLGPLEDMLSNREKPLPDALRESLALVHRNGLRLFKLVNNLLGFARMEAGRATLTYQATDLASFTAELVSHFDSAIQRAGLRLSVDLSALSEPVWVDREAWEKVVFNLLSNALKYTFEGSIAVALRQEGAEAVLSVRDTGTGIAAQALPHIFERFHRVEGTHARGHEGSGIGLFLVRELARLHGGSVSVRSEVGEGSTFTVRLPFGSAHLPQEQVFAAVPFQETASRAAPYLEEARGWLGERTPGVLREASSTAPRGPRVLVVDDNADMRAYLTGILTPFFEVRAVRDGLQALEEARARPPDLILSDVMMPRLGGFDLLREVRATPALRAVPFILLSARAGQEASVEGLEAGADDYLVKPFGARELLARVRAHLDLAHLRHEATLAEARESSLREAVHARDDFLSVASHELKTPLAALRLQLEALERLLPPEVRARMAARFVSVRRQIQRLTNLIETMMDVSLVAAGKLRVKPQPVDLAVLVADGVAQVREELARSGCALSFQSEASLPGHLDAMRMGQLVRNLLSNALRYGPGKPVEVRLFRREGRARLEVVDHGMGVKPEDRARIFNRFERAVSARHYGGLGLGLWVSRQVVEAHGGSITVTDTPGGGATLTVELPLHASA